MDNKKMYIRESDGALVKGGSLTDGEVYTLCPCEATEAPLKRVEEKVEEVVNEVKEAVKKAVKKVTKKATKKK